MKKCLGMVIWLLASLAFGQIEVTCSLPHKQILQYEPVRLTVTVANHTARELVLDDRDSGAWLGFDVESSPGILVPQRRDKLFPEGFRVPPRQTMTRMINLLHAYDLGPVGPYSICARIEAGDKIFLSPKILLDVVPGMEIGQFTGGVPDGSVRKISLRLQGRDRADHLFVRMDDEEAGKCYGVYDVGRIVRLFRPKIEISVEGDIHVLHQSGPWRYTHTVFGPDGEPLQVKNYTAEFNSISMEQTAEGEILVTGGSPYEGSPEAPPPDRDAGLPVFPASIPVDEPSPN